MFKQVTEKLKHNKKLSVAMILGIAGLLLIGLSEYMDTVKAEETQAAVQSSVSSREHIQELEKKLESIIGSIEGAGDCKVMISLDRMFESEYAANSTVDPGEDGAKSDASYVIVKNGSGDESGLLIAVREPRVLGVAVVCEGGESFAVKEAVINTVTALFAVDASSVAVYGGRVADGNTDNN